MKTYTLVIDTSIFGAGVALFNQESKALDFIEITSDVADSARQLPLIVEKGLGSLGVGRETVQRVIVSRGPGSFTGIRVGMAYSLGFASGLSFEGSTQPLITGVSSLTLLAQSLSVEIGGSVMALLPSTKTTGFAAFDEQGEFFTSAVDAHDPRTDALFLKKLDAQWVIIGTWDWALEWANKHSVKGFRMIHGRDAVALAIRAVCDALKANKKFDWVNAWSADLPRPIYLRKSTVEEKALQKPVVD